MKYFSTVLLVFLASFGFSQIIINEVQTSNSTTIFDEFGEYDDWLEIYNANDFAVDVGGMVFRDSVEPWAIPTDNENTLLQPGEFLLFWADDEESQGDFHTNFKLSGSNGEFLGLYDTDSITVLDSINLPPMSADLSFGRCDVLGWKILEKPTPVQVNDCPISVNNLSSTNIRIYPMMTNGIINIEFQNYNGQNIDCELFSLSGAKVLEKSFKQSSFHINTKNLNAGPYYLILKSENSIRKEKVIVL